MNQPLQQVPQEPFQFRVKPWLIACFGEAIAYNKPERNHRFLEESLELVQSTGCTRSEAHQLVDYVFNRPIGEPYQEVGGVMVTLAALCEAHGLDMHANGETELARIWTKVEQIREKQAGKPKHSPLPQHTSILTLDFDAWLKELDKIANIGGYQGSMVEATGSECWLDYFNDGETPADAYIEDLRCGL